MSKATERPWHTNEKGSLIYDEDNFCLATCHEGINFDKPHKANAALIVQAVNSYDKMRVALQFVLNQLAPSDTEKGTQCRLYSDCLHPIDDDKTVVDLIKEALHE